MTATLSLLGTPNVAQDAPHVAAVIVAMALAWAALSAIVSAVLRILVRRSSLAGKGKAGSRNSAAAAQRKKAAAPSSGPSAAGSADVRASGEYQSRVVSLVHSTVATAYCVYIAVQRYAAAPSVGAYASTIVCLDAAPTADEQYLACLVCGYFLYDTVGLLAGDFCSPLYLAHHAGSILVLLEALFGARPLGLEIAIGIGLLECSGPFLHARWLLNEHRWAERFPSSALWFAVEWSYLALFAVARVAVGNVLAVRFSPLVCAKTPVFSAVALGLLFAYSSVFFVGVVKQKLRGEKWVA